MNSGELITIFASHGFLCDSLALRYLQRHDYVEILQLIQEHEPSLLVVDLPAIRRVRRIEQKHTIVRYVDCFKSNPIRSIKKNPFSFIYTNPNKY